MKLLAIFACVALSVFAVPVAAINKCTGQDGRVSYQEAACPNSAKDSKSIAAQANGSTSDAAGVWKFKSAKDDMTGQASCFVISPVTFPVKPQPKGFYPVNAVLAFGGPDGPIFGMRTSEDKTLFHNDLSGMGIKIDAGEFTPLTVKSGSHILGVSSSAGVVAQLEKAQTLLARVRFWPFDQLYDLNPLAMDGYRAAVAQAKACATALKK